MRRIISCGITFAEFELVCAKCGKTILTMLAPEYAPAQLRHPPMACNEDGSHSFAGDDKGQMTFLSCPEHKKEAGWPEMAAVLTSMAGATNAVREAKEAIKRAEATKPTNS